MDLCLPVSTFWTCAFQWWETCKTILCRRPVSDAYKLEPGFISYHIKCVCFFNNKSTRGQLCYFSDHAPLPLMSQYLSNTDILCIFILDSSLIKKKRSEMEQYQLPWRPYQDIIDYNTDWSIVRRPKIVILWPLRILWRKDVRHQCVFRQIWGAKPERNGYVFSSWRRMDDGEN